MKRVKLIIYFVFLTLLVLSVAFNVIQYKKNSNYEIDLIKKDKQIEALEDKAKQSEEQSAKNKPTHPILTKRQQCLNQCYLLYDNIECMNQCVLASIPEWDKEISKILNEMKPFLSDDDYKKLLIAQENWEKYREIQTGLINKYVAGKSGIIHTNYATADIAQMTEDRALNLTSILYFIKQD